MGEAAATQSSGIAMAALPCRGHANTCRGVNVVVVDVRAIVVVVAEGIVVVVVVVVVNVVVDVVVDPTDVVVDEGLTVVVVVVVPHDGVNTVLADVDSAGATASKRTPDSEMIETTRINGRTRGFTQLNLLVAG